MNKKEALKNIINFTTLLLLTAVLSSCAKPAKTTHIDTCKSAIKTFSYAAAVSEADAAIALSQDAREAYRLKGIALFKLAKYEEAIESFKLSLSYSDGVIKEIDYDMNMYIAACYRCLGNNAEAGKIYDNILNLKKNDINVLLERGMNYLESGSEADADSDFNKAVSLNSKDCDMRVRIYQAYESFGMADTGKIFLQSALDAYRSSMTPYEIGMLQFYLGNNADAQSYLEKAFDSSSGAQKAKAALLLGQTGEKQDDLGYAISVYTQILDTDPSYSELLNRRGVCYMGSGEYDRAVKDFEAGLALNDPRFYQILLRNEIAAYEYAGDFSQAKIKMQKYSELFPDDAAAMRDKIFLETR